MARPKTIVDRVTLSLTAEDLAALDAATPPGGSRGATALAAMRLGMRAKTRLKQALAAASDDANLQAPMVDLAAETQRLRRPPIAPPARKRKSKLHTIAEDGTRRPAAPPTSPLGRQPGESTSDFLRRTRS